MANKGSYFVVYQGTPSMSATPVWDTKTTRNAGSLNLLGTNGVARSGSSGTIPPPSAPEPGQTLQMLTSSSGDPRFQQHVFVGNYPGTLDMIAVYRTGTTLDAEYFSVTESNPNDYHLPAIWFTANQVRFV